LGRPGAALTLRCPAEGHAGPGAGGRASEGAWKTWNRLESGRFVGTKFILLLNNSINQLSNMHADSQGQTLIQGVARRGARNGIC